METWCVSREIWNLIKNLRFLAGLVMKFQISRTDPNHPPQSGVGVGNLPFDAFRGELVPPGASTTK